MAALSLSAGPRSAFASLTRWTALRPSWSLPCVPSSSASTSASSPLPRSAVPAGEAALPSLERPTAPWSLSLIPLLDSLAELFPPILLAVPKSKVSHSRKSMRSANKGLKNKTSACSHLVFVRDSMFRGKAIAGAWMGDFSQCEACGLIKLAHNVCPNCYSQISRRWKREARGEVPPAGSAGGGSASAEV
ncbi:uncharacterized protein MKK02DRAFT_40788 [Dioszegia hungarica]|uniref:Large ribosomal subunit protein bL32m n=1 Tax=Dioszegia hungarica TaxID=4972 RepID=A0AA38H1T3_9TREE|nr:uncharacterized protein MKK02DRAFT_40788 [Dioszegia hungarica]KAI9632485.1 hypothetical protein MKK02DRAFT_40788 [Dioszegia hungarica]